MKVMSGHAVMIMDGDAMVDGRFGVTIEQIVDVIAELQAAPKVKALTSTGRTLQVLVDGRDMSESIARAPATEPAVQGESAPQKPEPGVSPAKGRGATRVKSEEESELKTAELAHHMLWESFKRSCQVQGFMLDKMTGCAVEMNRRFVQELETMRGNYTKALEQIDGLQFERKMLEHEATSRHLSAHYVRLAEEDHRAAERRRDDERSVLEQIARGVMRVVDVIGGDSIDGKN